MFNVEGTVRLVQIEVENECQIVEGVGEECVEADTAAQHHQEVEIMARRIVSDIPVMGVVGELFIHENLMPRPKESDSHLQSIHLHDVLEPGQRHFAHGHIFVAGGRAIRITRGVSERVQDQWLASSVVHQQSVGDITENERRGRCVNITEGGISAKGARDLVWNSSTVCVVHHHTHRGSRGHHQYRGEGVQEEHGDRASQGSRTPKTW